MAHAFVAIYSGETVSSAVLVAASAEQDLVHLVTDRILNSNQYSDSLDDCPDPVQRALNVGRKQALRRIEMGVNKHA